ncbi:MAG: hypothetical protein WA001_02235 [Patescibacteria group bacterium]
MGADEYIDEQDEKATVSATDTKLVLARKMIGQLRDELANLERLLASDAEPADLELLIKRTKIAGEEDSYGPASEGKIVEGVFDGQNMVGSDGRQYIVPPNYASKSKLVEGDILKLTIQASGTFQYKQIGPIERQRVVGALTRDEITNDWRVVAQGKKYHVLPAAVSYFKGDAGDDAVLLVPKAAPSRWAAVENVIKRS